MLIKGGDAIELLAKPGILVLDKTGTVTEGRTTLTAWVGPEWVKPLVLALEAGSSHPIADGFRRAWPALTTPQVEASRHVVGGGMEGVIDGRTVCIGSPRFVAERTCSTDERLRFASEAMDRTHTPVHVAVDGVLIAVAALGDRVRDEALASLQQLRARGWRTVMLSGDATDVVASVGRALEFEAQDAIGAASPEDKRAFVERSKQDGTVVMVGDGVNDAAAIAAAHVGIGMHGGAEACLTTADIYLSRPGLSGLVELTEGARRTMRVIRRNIAFSIGYNILGASMAVAGILTPLIAAVLMPTSSISVVLGSWYGFTFARDRQGTAAP
jgi:Cu2+-exporting ATPase